MTNRLTPNAENAENANAATNAKRAISATNSMSATKTKHARTLLAAALTASALIGLSACGSATAKPSAAAAASTAASTTQQSPAPGNSTASQPSTPTASQPPATDPAQNSTQNQTATQTATRTQAPAPKTTTAHPASKPSEPTNPTTESDLPGACTPDHLKGTVTTLAHPVNHVLLTVTNTGSTTCDLYYYPDLRLDADQQAVTQALEDSKPQAVVTIAPGESGYAAIGTSAADGSGGTPRLEKQVEVFLETRDQSGSLPGSMTLPLPAGTYVDDKAFVTYWQSDLQSATAW